MIQLKRPKTVPQPVKTSSVRRKKADTKIKAIVASSVDLKSTDFTPLWRDDAVRGVIWKMHNGRCCYCERYRDETRESDVEHFRPKTAVSGTPTLKPGYWWLAYEWSNLLFACKTCNQKFKGTKFPITGKRARKKSDSLAKESPLLIDAVKENPEDFLDYDFTRPKMIVPHGKSPNLHRGNKTIEICGLDRDELNRQRYTAKKDLVRILKRMFKALDAFSVEGEAVVGKEIAVATSAKEGYEFVGMRRAFFRQFDGTAIYVSSD